MFEITTPLERVGLYHRLSASHFVEVISTDELLKGQPVYLCLNHVYSSDNPETVKFSREVVRD